MKVRKLQYNIDYTHILTFRDHYKELVYPAFGRENTQYAIDNENTQLESIRLIFPNEGYVIQLRRDGMSMMYEGDISLLKRSNVATDTFFEIYDRLEKTPQFTKTVRQRLIIDFVEFRSKEEIQSQLKENKFIAKALPNLSDFAVIMEFDRAGLHFNLKFGNFSEVDIEKSTLSPLGTEFNKELLGKYGLMANVNVYEDTKTVSHSKMKDLMTAAEEVLNEYVTINNGQRKD